MSEMTRETQAALADDLLAKFEYMVAAGSAATHHVGSEVYIDDNTKREYSIESVRLPIGIWGDGIANIRYYLTAVTHRYGVASIEVTNILTEAPEADIRDYLKWMRPRDIEPAPQHYGDW